MYISLFMHLRVLKFGKFSFNNELKFYVIKQFFNFQSL